MALRSGGFNMEVMPICSMNTGYVPGIVGDRRMQARWKALVIGNMMSWLHIG